MKQGIRIFFLIISLLSGGLIYHEQVTVGFGILTIYFAVPCFIISSLIAVLITTKSKIKFVHKRLGGLMIWLISITLLICILFAVNKIRNLSPVLFSTKFYWEEGVDVEFRENRTFKALNYHMMGGDITYGKYELADSLIILKDKLKFGNENMKDTLKISNEGIAFTMEKPWRINEGVMSFEYLPITDVEIENNTENKIDSLFIKTYTKEPISIVSVKPNQIIKYKFDMKNPYVNGEYQLSFKNNGRLNQHTNFLKGYPLETVETIMFKELKVDINLIFGNTISINYR
jgi:hypothetical protein